MVPVAEQCWWWSLAFSWPRRRKITGCYGNGAGVLSPGGRRRGSEQRGDEPEREWKTLNQTDSNYDVRAEEASKYLRGMYKPELCMLTLKSTLLYLTFSLLSSHTYLPCKLMPFLCFWFFQRAGLASSHIWKTCTPYRREQQPCQSAGQWMRSNMFVFAVCPAPLGTFYMSSKHNSMKQYSRIS